MWALLNWRLWILTAALVLYPVVYMKGRSDGRKIERLEYAAAVGAANKEARQIEAKRASAVDKAQRSAAARAVGNRADSARSAGAALGLRDAIRAQRVAEESATACAKRADTLGELLVESIQEYRSMAETADRILNDRQLLLDSWPK